MKKYITRFMCITFSLMMIAALSINSYAITFEEKESMIEELINNKNETKSAYVSQIEDIMLGLISEKELLNDSNAKYLQGSADIVASYDIESAYRVSILEPLLLSVLQENGAFKDAITNTVQWKVPITTERGESGLAVLVEDDGILVYAGTVVGESTRTWMITDSGIREAVMNTNDIEEKYDSMQIVHSYLYNTTFVYLSAKGDEYLIPYSTYAKEIGISNGQLYSVSDIARYFNKCFDEKQLSDSPNHGGAPFRRQPIFSTNLTIFIALAIAAILFLGIYIKTARKKNDF